MVINVLSVVGVVALNKYIQVQHNFVHSTLLTGMHFAFTALGLRLLCASGVFEHGALVSVLR